MEPSSFGKKLGIGVRVAGNIARDRAQEASARRASSPASPSVNPVPAQIPDTISRKAEELAAKTRNVGQGIGRGSKQFKKSFFAPLATAGSVLWMEVTGLFFALFAAFFAQNIYRVRSQYASGPDHRTFLLYCGLTLVFAYFSISSFVRARRKSRKQAAGR